MPSAAETPQVTKRKVTMRAFAGYDPEGNVIETVAEDYVNEEDGILDAYVAARRAAGWHVDVGDYDAGPGGYDGETFVPDDIDHPRAGEFRPATGQAFHRADPAHPDNDGVSPVSPRMTARHLGISMEELNDHPAVQRFMAKQQGA